MPFPPDEAIAIGLAFLEGEADRGFPGAVHRIRFPRRAGFLGPVEEHASDVFGRAVLGGLMLDIADGLGPGPSAAALRPLARREAAHVADARLIDRGGGWSYFPGLPELPPDLDSLAAAIDLFARIAPEFLPLCEGPIALARPGPDGGRETWIVAGSDPPRARSAMRRGIARFWGSGVDLDVNARFLRALLRADPSRHEAEIRRGARLVRSRQRPDGGWDSAWYWGEAQAIDLAAGLLLDSGAGEAEIARAARFLLESRRPDGGWGVRESVPLDTALALGFLARLDPSLVPREALDRGLSWLLDRQALGGFWGGTPWLKMDVRRARGGPPRLLTHQSSTISTAFALRALISALHRISVDRGSPVPS